MLIVTNQSGVGRGYFTMGDVESVNQRVREEFGRFGVTFDKIYVAPEEPETPSKTRKPSPGFLLAARDQFGLDLRQSYMVGDKLSDLECGWNAGVKKCFLVRTGYGPETERECGDRIRQAVVVDNLAAVADWILEQDSTSKIIKEK